MTKVQKELKHAKTVKALLKKAKPDELISGLRVVDPEKVEIARLNVAEYNPRIISRKELEALKASIIKYGLILNFVVQKSGMVIIGGHQRLKAAQELCRTNGWEMPTHAWAVVLDIDDATAKQLNIALNNISGEFDPHKLGMIFADIYPRMTPADVVATGFSVENIVELQALVAPKPEEEVRPERDIGSFATTVTMSVAFETVEQRDQAKEKLARLCKEQDIKPGAMISRMLAMSLAMKTPKRR